MTKYMTVKRIGTNDDVDFYFTETIASGNGTSIVVYPLPIGTVITCTLKAGSNTGRFETTTDSIAMVEAGTAEWEPWALGTKTGIVSDAIANSVIAIRGVSVSGAVTINVVA